MQDHWAKALLLTLMMLLVTAWAPQGAFATTAPELHVMDAPADDLAPDDQQVEAPAPDGADHDHKFSAIMTQTWSRTRSCHLTTARTDAPLIDGAAPPCPKRPPRI